jgi:hypothetical protein
MGTSDSKYSSNVLVRNLKSHEEVVKKRGAKKKTGGAKKKTRGLAKSAPRKSRIARYDRVNEEDDDDGMITSREWIMTRLKKRMPETTTTILLW